MALEDDLRGLVGELAKLHSDAGPAAAVLAARDLRDASEALYLRAGAEVHEAGMTWASLAEALGLAGAGSAHFAFAADREARLERLRRRTPPRVKSSPSAVPEGSLTLQQAADRIGVSVSTLRRRIEAGAVKAVSISTPGGRVVWSVREADLPQAE